MTTYILRRFLAAVLTIWVVVTVVFAMLDIIPGDPALLILGPDSAPRPEALEAVRTRLGLDRPFHERYWSYVSGLVRLDLGNSLYDGRPVSEEIGRRLPRTLNLIAAAMTIAVVVGLPLGIGAALVRGRPLDLFLGNFIALGLSTPVYVIGVALLAVFSVYLGWLPSAGYVAPSDDLIGHLRSLAMPAATLAISIVPVVARIARSSFLEILSADFIRTARGKGVSNVGVLFHHALRPAVSPVVTIVGIQVGTLIGGSVVVEYIFVYPGISSMILQSMARRDYPMIQGALIVVAVGFVLINFVVDFVYTLLDPRISLSGGGDA